MIVSKENALLNVGGVFCSHADYSALYWPCFDTALKRLELIAEDHCYTFKTVEQLHQRGADGRVFDPCAHLPYGPTITKDHPGLK